MLGQALNELDLQIHSKLRFEDVLQSTLEGYVAALDADAGDIKLFDGEEWVVGYVTGFEPDVIGTRLTVAEAPVAERAAQLREPVTIADYPAEPAEFYVGFPARHALVATLAVPLIVRQEVIGCLFAWMRTEPRVFTREEVDFARRVATSVGLALENVRLFEAEQEARERAEQAERRLTQELETTRVLLRAADELTSATTPDEILKRLASIVLDVTGLNRVFINLIDVRERVLVPRIPENGLAAPMGERIPFENLSQTARQAIADMSPALLDYERPDTPARDREIASANRTRLALFVPLVYRCEIIGHITVDEPDARYEFSTEQTRILASIAAQASVALKNASQLEREHRIAETLQHAILAPPIPIESLEIAYWYESASTSASVGGDFYDVFELGDDRTAVVIGDVAGKGIGAAQTMMLVRDGIRAYLLDDPDPATVFARVNTLVHASTATEVFATAFLGVIEGSTGCMRYCNAGHPAPSTLSARRQRQLEMGSGLLGAFEQIAYENHEITLAPDEVLCMITDGVTEARRGDALFGAEGVLDALARLAGVPLASLPHRLLNEVVGYTNGVLRDDIAILCVARRSRRR